MAETSKGVETPAEDVKTLAEDVKTPATDATTSTKNDETPSTDNTDNDCAICLQTMVQPTELPCKHVFCFLCVKGIAQKTRCCALCRREIPHNYFDSPHLLNDPSNDKGKGKGEACYDDSDKPLWYYKGRSGWWQYDDRTCQELEDTYSKGSPFCEVLIAGYLYIIDFRMMTQYRKDDPIRRRNVKRDTEPVPVKGVAGVYAPSKDSSSAPNRKTYYSNHAAVSSDSDEGPSCSVFVLNILPSQDEPSTSGAPRSQRKTSQRGCNGRFHVKPDEVSDNSDNCDDSDDSDDHHFYDCDDFDDDDDDEDYDVGDDDDDDTVFSVYVNRASMKRNASNTGVPPSSKKPLQMNSADYTAALELLKSEHKHMKQSMKLKHIRSLVNKKTKLEIMKQKERNYAELGLLERKQREEYRKFIRKHREVHNLYD